MVKARVQSYKIHHGSLHSLKGCNFLNDEVSQSVSHWISYIVHIQHRSSMDILKYWLEHMGAVF